MKRYIFPFLLCALLAGANTFAQQAKTITGSFKGAHTKSAKGADVNYSLTLSTAKDKLSLTSNSNDEMFFSDIRHTV